MESNEYLPMEKAATISSDAKVKEAALASASWESYQIMRFHLVKLCYPSVQHFLDKMCNRENNQLDAFGRYTSTFGCLTNLRNKDWAKFVKRYNWPVFAGNKYDIKRANTYNKHL